MDTSIAVWLNEAAQHSGLRQLAEAAAKFLVGLPVVIVACLAVRSVLRRDANAVASLLVAGVGTAIALATNVAATSWWYRARPYTALHDVHALIAPNPESSFFSDHTIVVTGCALAALLVSRRWGIFTALAAAAVAVARVAVGAHYPTDVLAAAAITSLATAAMLPARPKIATGVDKLFKRLSASLAGRSTTTRPARSAAS